MLDTKKEHRLLRKTSTDKLSAASRLPSSPSHKSSPTRNLRHCKSLDRIPRYAQAKNQSRDRRGAVRESLVSMLAQEDSWFEGSLDFDSATSSATSKTLSSSSSIGSSGVTESGFHGKSRPGTSIAEAKSKGKKIQPSSWRDLSLDFGAANGDSNNDNDSECSGSSKKSTMSMDRHKFIKKKKNKSLQRNMQQLGTGVLDPIHSPRRLKSTPLQSSMSVSSPKPSLKRSKSGGALKRATSGTNLKRSTSGGANFKRSTSGTNLKRSSSGGNFKNYARLSSKKSPSPSSPVTIRRSPTVSGKERKKPISKDSARTRGTGDRQEVGSDLQGSTRQPIHRSNVGNTVPVDATGADAGNWGSLEMGI